ncbi:hypothetical protein CSR02_14655 [Acetobacter pomorum]|uniref:Flagellar assembly protein FliH/Type III secretion system HrpE domain-containing protein n=1 Tax=Acetobacter pomorum TaxID=65959 RepID=A0A2G4R8I3_9PROT|nr:hypothetical protein [Acetobacter pomorum]PHY92864.1 hypothetical protein CSR02_14655 [Acetobacter pomorum]GBR53186.1 hypothetical protein AA11825_2424 [Acetobacter pomorum DSM 11825]
MEVIQGNMIDKRRRMFGEALPDFSMGNANSSPHGEGKGEAIVDDQEGLTLTEEPVVDHSIRLAPEELESIKSSAFEAGRKAGIEYTTNNLRAEMAQSIHTVISALASENDRRNASLLDSSKVFLTVLSAVIRDLVDPQSVELCKALQKDLTTDIRELAKEIQGRIIVECSPGDSFVLKDKLADIPDLEVVEQKGLSTGQLTVKTDANSILLDRAIWLESVRKKILGVLNNLKLPLSS